MIRGTLVYVVRVSEISIHCFSDLPSFLCHVRGLGSTSSLLRRWRTFEGQMFALVGGLLHTCLRHVLPKWAKNPQLAPKKKRVDDCINLYKLATKIGSCQFVLSSSWSWQSMSHYRQKDWVNDQLDLRANSNINSVHFGSSRVWLLNPRLLCWVQIINFCARHA